FHILSPVGNRLDFFGELNFNFSFEHRGSEGALIFVSALPCQGFLISTWRCSPRVSSNPSEVAMPETGFHIMTKPIGPICNLDCKYCFYLEKENLYPDQRKWKMSDEVLEEYISQYILGQPQDEISFAWQGGEPTLLGVEYFRNVVRLQKKYASGKKISNAFQTNGTLLDDEWCEFLTENRFLVGLSIDGPRELHD